MRGVREDVTEHLNTAVAVDAVSTGKTAHNKDVLHQHHQVFAIEQTTNITSMHAQKVRQKKG
jgi:hypothetical protein